MFYKNALLLYKNHETLNILFVLFYTKINVFKKFSILKISSYSTTNVYLNYGDIFTVIQSKGIHVFPRIQTYL